jgi:hypothetical protein
MNADPAELRCVYAQIRGLEQAAPDLLVALERCRAYAADLGEPAAPIVGVIATALAKVEQERAEIYEALGRPGVEIV